MVEGSGAGLGVWGLGFKAKVSASQLFKPRPGGNIQANRTFLKSTSRQMRYKIAPSRIEAGAPLKRRR
jgi:hypothetical protein